MQVFLLIKRRKQVPFTLADFSGITIGMSLVIAGMGSGTGLLGWAGLGMLLYLLVTIRQPT